MRAIVWFACCLFALAGFSLVIANDNLEDNLCYDIYDGQCHTQEEWEIGWFWANHLPSDATCTLYHQVFGNIGDIWGLCHGYNFQNGASAHEIPHSMDPIPENETEAERERREWGYCTDNNPDTPCWHGVTAAPFGVCNMPPPWVDIEYHYDYDTSGCVTDF